MTRASASMNGARHLHRGQPPPGDESGRSGALDHAPVALLAARLATSVLLQPARFGADAAAAVPARGVPASRRPKRVAAGAARGRLPERRCRSRPGRGVASRSLSLCRGRGARRADSAPTGRSRRPAAPTQPDAPVRLQRACRSTAAFRTHSRPRGGPRSARRRTLGIVSARVGSAGSRRCGSRPERSAAWVGRLRRGVAGMSRRGVGDHAGAP